ncbi:MAG: Crp/Fnr family transcriptional regulator [Hyphomicrobiales bacterium]|nr:Crp/Fnr family transcriptional regulator [Hyphomicrobiales bacterium]
MSTHSACTTCSLESCHFRDSVTAAEADGERLVHSVTALERGGRVWRSGVGCRRLWVVVGGLAALATALPDGRRQITSLISSGDIVCPVSDRDGGESWGEALSPMQICEIDLHALIATPQQSDGVWGSLFRATHRQLERSNANLVMLGRFDGVERICLFLVEMAQRLGVAGPGGYRVHLPMSREDIADYLGLNSETVSRLLTRVRKTRLVTFISPTDFVVHDLFALARRTPTKAIEPATDNGENRIPPPHPFAFSSPFKAERMETIRSSDK